MEIVRAVRHGGTELEDGLFLRKPAAPGELVEIPAQFGGARELQHRRGVIVEVGSHPETITHHGYTQILQMGTRAYARAQQDLGTAVRARGQDDVAELLEGASHAK